MAQVFFYQDRLAELGFKLGQIEAKIDYLAQRSKKSPAQIMAEDLSDSEAEEYVRLLSRFQLLKQWEGNDNDKRF